MHGGVKFYRGSAGAARSYVEADRSRADDYYLAEGTGLAVLLVASAVAGAVEIVDGGTLDGDAYEQWVDGYNTDGTAKGRLRTDAQGLRFVEVVVNGPKTWSLAAAVHPEIAASYDAAQDRAAREIVGWLAEHSTTRVGPRGRQVQVPVEKLEAAVVRHQTSRAGDPHRHLHLQINARVFAGGRWRGLHSVGVVDSIEAINGIGHAAIATDPEFRRALADHGYTLDPDTGEIAQLQPFVAGFSARAAQIGRNVARFETEWRREHPGQEPGPRLRQTWDRGAWATARPDKITPTAGTDLTAQWVQDLTDAGFTPPPRPSTPADPAMADSTADPTVSASTVSALNRDAVTDLALIRLGGRRSAWNTADIRGEVEKIIATTGLVLDPVVRRELAEDLTDRTHHRCIPLLDRADVPEHVRALTSSAVLEVEADIVERLLNRSAHHGFSVPPTPPAGLRTGSPRRAGSEGGFPAEFLAGFPGHLPTGGTVLDPQQLAVVGALAGTHRLLLVEGAAGAGKTTTLSAARDLLEQQGRRLVVLTPTLKAAQVASIELGTPAFTAAWFAHQHGYRWDNDNHWTRPTPTSRHSDDGPHPVVALSPMDVLLVDEAGMLDQDTARALLTIADETHAQIAFVGDRHQLPAVGRGGVLDLTARYTPPHARLELDTVHRFTDPDYANLSLQMRTGHDPGTVFDTLLARGDIVIHPTDVERLAHLTDLAANRTEAGAGQPGQAGPLVIADTREQVRALNAAIRAAYHDHRTGSVGPVGVEGPGVLTAAGEVIGVGDRVTTRRNDPDLRVANRDQWTVTGTNDDGTLTITGRAGNRTLPTTYVQAHVELAYATTVYGAQGDTVDAAHFLLGDTTGAASAYVAMTRGRRHNTAHLVADTTDDARAQWAAVFSRDLADLGPTHAATRALDAIDRYGPAHAAPSAGVRHERLRTPTPHEAYPAHENGPTRGIGR